MAELQDYSIEDLKRIAGLSKGPDLNALVQSNAAKYGVDPDLIHAVIHQESGGNQKAVSNKGALGTMQLMPDTAKAMGVDPSTVEGNIEGGTKYFSQMLKQFNGDTNRALAAYNAGPVAVDAFTNGKRIVLANGKVINPNAIKTPDGIPPYAETQDYVKKISGNYETAKKNSDTREYSIDELKQIAGQQEAQAATVPQEKPFSLADAAATFLRKGTQAATFGLSEPVAAGASALIAKGIDPEKPIGGLYDQFRDKQKASLDRQVQDNKAAGIAGDVAGLVAPGGLANGVFKGVGSLTSAGGRAVENLAPRLAEKTPAFLKWLTGAATEGALGGGIAAGINPDDNASALQGAELGAASNAALGTVGKALGGVGSLVKSGASKLMNTALETPKKYRTDGQDLGKYVLENMSPTLSLQNLAKQGQGKIDVLENELQDKLAGHVGQKVNQHTVFNDLLALKEQYANTPGAADKVRAIDNHIEELLANKTFSKPDVPTANELKRNITRQRQGKAYETETPTIKQEIDKATASGYRKGVEDLVPKAAGINQQMIPYIQLNKTLRNTLANEKKGLPTSSARDWILGLGGAYTGGVPGALLGAASYGSKTKAGQLGLAQLMQKSGNLGQATEPVAEGLAKILAPFLLQQQAVTQLYQQGQ